VRAGVLQSVNGNAGGARWWWSRGSGLL